MAHSNHALGEVRKVLVVVKETEYAQALAHEDARQLALIGESDRSTDGKLQAHQEHVATVEEVFAYLGKRGIESVTELVTSLPQSLNGYDLIITVGGDGTFLSTAALNLDTPMLGVRSTLRPCRLNQFLDDHGRDSRRQASARLPDAHGCHASARCL